MEGFRSLDDGSVVEFAVVQGDKGSEARDVTGPSGEEAVSSRYAKRTRAPKNRGRAQLPKDVPGMAMFVGNLTWETTDDELKAAFAKYEPVFAAVTLDEDGKSVGHGVVSVADEAARETCIGEMNETDLNGRAINCAVFKQQTGAAAAEDSKEDEGDAKAE